MKNASPALITFLTGNKQFITADCYTFTLSSGQVIRYTSHDLPVFVNGFNYPLGPPISDGGVTQDRGFQVDDLQMNINADDRHTINGVNFLDFVESGGFDNANVRVDRAYSAGPGEIWVGTLNRFVGQVAPVDNLGATGVQITVSSGLEVLNVNIPADVYQSSCLNVVYGLKCGILASAYVVSGATTSAAGPGDDLATNLTNPSGYFDGGTITFTSGLNEGVVRMIKTSDVSGALTITPPLTFEVASGDTFTALPGCNLSMADCKNKFANLIHFRGQPFVPAPATLLGGSV